ncbi:MAG: hypothetical protein QM688_01415 [Sphingomonas bacterium]
MAGFSWHSCFAIGGVGLLCWTRLSELSAIASRKDVVVATIHFAVFATGMKPLRDDCRHVDRVGARNSGCTIETLGPGAGRGHHLPCDRAARTEAERAHDRAFEFPTAIRAIPHSEHVPAAASGIGDGAAKWQDPALAV